ncbi:MAG TPA: class I SAM-dependent methyltransferase [Candidatus Omnitrophota bacterium]|nr:class I SAM-dependent methyltransferase [Candidatus Omnitrophota bacterium]
MDMESYYKRLFETHGDTPQAVQYSDQITQERRFKVLTEIADLNDMHILDFGCGTGHLATFLKAQDTRCSYTGVDLVQEMLDCGKKKHPEHQFLKPEELSKGQQFDYAFISGVFNLKTEDNRSFYQRIIKDCFNRIRKGLAFNMMSSYVDYFDPQLFYEKPETVFQFIKEKISPFVVLRNEYQVKKNVIPFEFTIYVYKK